VALVPRKNDLSLKERCLEYFERYSREIIAKQYMDMYDSLFGD
jgi:hypothetical protein